MQQHDGQAIGAAALPHPPRPDAVAIHGDELLQASHGLACGLLSFVSPESPHQADIRPEAVLAVGLTQLMAMAPDVAHYGAVVQAPEGI